ncbi:hypothetical protein D3C76_156420 [compost metagenome]
MQRLDEVFQLGDADIRKIRVCGVGAFRHIIVLRIVPPVVMGVFQTAFIHALSGVIENRQQLHMRYAQPGDVVETRRNPVRPPSSFLSQAQELALLADAAARVNRQIAKMQLINHGIYRRFERRLHILLPSLRVGAPQIEDRRFLPVHAHCSCVRVRRLIPLLPNLDAIRI